jgi:hypothetical protein
MTNSLDIIHRLFLKMDNVQQVCHFNNTPSSQTFRSVLLFGEYTHRPINDEQYYIIFKI